MKLTEIARDSSGGCGVGGCPAVYTTDESAVLVVQGKILDTPTTRELTRVAGDETAVAIPRDVLLQAAALLERQP